MYSKAFVCVFCVVFNIAVNLNGRESEHNTHPKHNTTQQSINWTQFTGNAFAWTNLFFTLLHFSLRFLFLSSFYSKFSFGLLLAIHSLCHTQTHTHVCVCVCYFSVVCYSGANVLCVHNIRAFILCIHTEKTWNIKQVLKRKTGVKKRKGEQREEWRKGRKKWTEMKLQWQRGPWLSETCTIWATTTTATATTTKTMFKATSLRANRATGHKLT